jgi:hypothetical protein
MTKISPDDASARVRAVFGDNVEVKSLQDPTSEDSETDVVDLITRVCYFYPQYDLETAQDLTHAQVTALLLQAEKQRAIELYNHVLIAAAPHSKKGKMVDKLIKQYKKIAEM